MPSVASVDGTTIATDRSGAGPVVVIVGGVVGDRSQQAPVADLLSAQFTVYNYDRRGHGESGFTGPYSVAREAEDLAAVIAEAGGAACVYATSGRRLPWMTAVPRFGPTIANSSRRCSSRIVAETWSRCS